MSTSREPNASNRRPQTGELADDESALDLTDDTPAVDLRDAKHHGEPRPRRWGSRKAADSKVSAVPERWRQRRRAVWHRD